MSSKHRQRYEDASDAVRRSYFDPLNEFADAARSWIEDAERRAIAAEATLEALRPVWAQGHTSDSMAAQGTAGALSELWTLLGVKDQTSAVERLRDLIAVGKTAPANIWAERTTGTWHPGDET